jgi:hypothetical protein
LCCFALTLNKLIPPGVARLSNFHPLALAGGNGESMRVTAHVIAHIGLRFSKIPAATPQTLSIPSWIARWLSQVSPLATSIFP